MRALTLLLLATLVVCWPDETEAQAVRILDDFKTGPKVSFLASGSDAGVQAGTMVGGFRRTNFIVQPFPVAHLGLFQIRPNGPLIVSCGYKVAHRLEVSYGVAGNGTNAPLNLDLRTYDKFVLDFEASDAGINLNIVIFWASGAYYAIEGFNLSASNVPFTVEFPFSDFTPGVPSIPPDFMDIDFIAVIAQTGSAIGSNDYAIRGFKAVAP